jgi:hypothetical protein
MPERQGRTKKNQSNACQESIREKRKVIKYIEAKTKEDLSFKTSSVGSM